MKDEAYMKIYRKISLKPLRRVLTEFDAQQITEYLKVFSDLSLDGWDEGETNGLESLFSDMERWLHNHYNEND